MTGERWLSFRQAVEVTIQIAADRDISLSIGRAQHLVRSAKASGEVRIKNDYDPVLLTADDGIVGMDFRPGAMNMPPGIKRHLGIKRHRGLKKFERQFNEDDLRDWLRRHLSPARPKRKGRRYSADDKLVKRAVAGFEKKKWANALQAATALADRAKGTSRASTITRLQKKISAALGE